MQQRRNAAIEKVRIQTQVSKSTRLGSILLAYVCAFVICEVSETKRINVTVHSGQLEWRVN